MSSLVTMGIKPEDIRTKEEQLAEVYRSLARHCAGMAEAYKQLHRLTQEDAQKR